MLANKTMCQWCKGINALGALLFTAFACLADLKIGFAFTAYELIRAFCMQVQAEEKLIEEFDREQQG